MRYGSEHKVETRKKILDIASRRFRTEGVNAVGIVSLMADAGLTHGGFYAHFMSKEELVAAVLDHALSESGKCIRASAEREEDTLNAYIRAYLSPSHRDGLTEGCSFAALAAELSRHSDHVRDTAHRGLIPNITWIGDLLPASDPASAQRQATAIFSLLMGSLQLARLATDREISDSILESGIKAALDLVSVFEGV